MGVVDWRKELKLALEEAGVAPDSTWRRVTALTSWWRDGDWQVKYAWSVHDVAGLWARHFEIATRLEDWVQRLRQVDPRFVFGHYELYGSGGWVELKLFFSVDKSQPAPVRLPKLPKVEVR